MTLTRLTAAIAAAALMLTGCGGTEEEVGSSDAPESYRDGDVVTLLVGQEAGGGFDTLARLFQPTLEKALQKETGADVRVQVVNKPGGNNVVAAQEVSRAAPDGKTIYLGSSERLVEIDVYQDDANFDLAEVTPLGILGVSTRGIIVRKDLGISDPDLPSLIEYAKGKEVRLASPGAGERLALLDELLTEGGGSPTGFRHVGLSGGTAEYIAGILRGDVEAVFTTAASLNRYVEENPDKLAWVVNLGCERDEAFDQVPTVVDQNLPNAEKICATLGSYARSFVAPPGMDGPRLEALRSAIKAAAESEEYREAATKVGDPPAYQTPEQESELFQEIVETYTEYRDVLDVES
jgi:tripartite-type tricarboxylate transporter receptor subunit TctC